MSAIVECVPNFSEGKRSDVIDAISDAIKDTNECTLLDVDSGISTNRTVYTFVGSPSSVVEGALNAAKVAFKLIDMTKHRGIYTNSHVIYHIISVFRGSPSYGCLRRVSICSCQWSYNGGLY